MHIETFFPPLRTSWIAFSRFVFFFLLLNLFFALWGRTLRSRKSYSGPIWPLCNFVQVGYLYRSFDIITPYLSVYFKQQSCRLHITTFVTIFPFFHLDVKIVFLVGVGFFLSTVLGRSFCLHTEVSMKVSMVLLTLLLLDATVWSHVKNNS